MVTVVIDYALAVLILPALLAKVHRALCSSVCRNLRILDVVSSQSDKYIYTRTCPKNPHGGLHHLLTKTLVIMIMHHGQCVMAIYCNGRSYSVLLHEAVHEHQKL